MPNSSKMQPLVSLCLRLLVLFTLASFGRGEQDNMVDCQPPSQPPSKNDLKFLENVGQLFKALPSSARAAGGFASLAWGNGSDRAFVRGICRGDAMLSDCQTCLDQAGQGIISKCSSRSSRRAGIWYQECFVFYADTNASTGHEDAYQGYNQDAPEYYNEEAFEKTYKTLMTNLSSRAGNGVPESPWPATSLFATGHTVFDRDARNGTMYGLVQCMTDRTAECHKCLTDRVDQLDHAGVIVAGYNCYLRTEIYPFYYDLAFDEQDRPHPPPPSSLLSFIEQGKGKNYTIIVILVVALPVGILLFVVGVIIQVILYKRKVGQKARPTVLTDDCGKEEIIGFVDQLEQLNIQLLREGTDNFSQENKLGEGGFGEVFKGTLKDGEQIAVKRLSKHSSQGFHELKTELVLAAKLKHKNIARLIGACLKQEKFLVYEYMSNSSLDTFLFDPVKRQQLDWGRRYRIICGIAQGLRYLHEESHLKVIHRDLKPSNVLLDADMNAKISDFGLARAFGGDQSRDVTRRPAGTLGYMSPEYAYNGHVSTKSDIFSFGVIVLEMVTGRKTNSNYECLDSTSLLSYAWKKWRSGLALDLVDASLQGQYPESKVIDCLEVGLLCVQENPADRPDASAVVHLLLLGRSNSEPDEGRREPSMPAFSFRPGEGGSSDDAIRDGQTPSSRNMMTISDFQPR